MVTETDVRYMRLALKEAKKGVGRTSPNPCVGAVIVHDGKIISKGFHEKAGEPHAEVNAIRRAKEALTGSTIYVTLEPCNHTGKTPPCTHAIIKAGIARVVVGMVDPNPLVSGMGLKFLEENGIEVKSGVLAEQCEAINYPFIKHITSGLPWMVMKAGISLDGKLNYKTGESGWITGPESLAAVHKLRDQFDAIMVGRNTALVDNPSLTTRLKKRKGKDPLRVVLDSQLSLPLDAQLFNNDSDAQTWVFCRESAPVDKQKKLSNYHNVRVIVIESEGRGLDLKKIIEKLGQEGVCSVLVEGGARLHGALLKDMFYDYAYLFQAPIFAGDRGISLLEGVSALSRKDAPAIVEARYRRLGEDCLIHGKINYHAAQG